MLSGYTATVPDGLSNDRRVPVMGRASPGAVISRQAIASEPTAAAARTTRHFICTDSDTSRRDGRGRGAASTEASTKLSWRDAYYHATLRYSHRQHKLIRCGAARHARGTQRTAARVVRAAVPFPHQPISRHIRSGGWCRQLGMYFLLDRSILGEPPASLKGRGRTISDRQRKAE